MKRSLLLLTLFLSLIALPSRAATYTVAFDATWPPFEFINTNGELVGYTVDLVTAVSREAGFAIHAVVAPWDGIFARLNNGKYDIVASSITITPERQRYLAFSAPYFETFQYLLLPTTANTENFSSMKGKILGAQTGTMGQSLGNSYAGFITKPYDELIDAVTDLAEGKIGGVICDYPVALYYSNTREFANTIKLAPFTITDMKEEYGFAVRQSDKALLEMLNTGLAAVKSKKIDREIYAKWFGEKVPAH
ncbi:MAG: ABC transporter arginine-binding protein 1 [Desulfovibrio sp.]